MPNCVLWIFWEGLKPEKQYIEDTHNTIAQAKIIKLVPSVANYPGKTKENAFYSRGRGGLPARNFRYGMLDREKLSAATSPILTLGQSDPGSQQVQQGGGAGHLSLLAYIRSYSLCHYVWGNVGRLHIRTQ